MFFLSIGNFHWSSFFRTLSMHSRYFFPSFKSQFIHNSCIHSYLIFFPIPNVHTLSFSFVYPNHKLTYSLFHLQHSRSSIVLVLISTLIKNIFSQLIHDHDCSSIFCLIHSHFSLAPLQKTSIFPLVLLSSFLLFFYIYICTLNSHPNPLFFSICDSLPCLYSPLSTSPHMIVFFNISPPSLFS